MTKNPQSPVIVLAEDDPDDRLLFKEVMEDIPVPNPVEYIEDGQQLMDYLQRQGNYAHLQSTPLPGLILLDLNMPRKDGREALKEIKQNPALRHIPIVIMTTSNAEEDMHFCYGLGVNSFVSKPAGFDDMVGTIKKVLEYWLDVVHG